MKTQKYHAHKVEGEPVKTFKDPASDEMMQDVIGTKMLYNWLYKEEEENYYLSAKVSDPIPDFAQEALFVEY